MKKNKKYPLVSVIMNSHNGSKYLKESINSICSQTYKNWELIFWDNSSTDNTKKKLKFYKDTRIKYFYSKKFNSLYKSRNLAIKKAKGKYISFLDVDDKWKKNKLTKQIKFLENNSMYHIIYSNYYYTTNKKVFLKFSKKLPSGFITQDLLNTYCMGILTVTLRSSIFKRKRFKNIYEIIGDFDFFLELSKNYKIACVQEPLAIYRVHEENLSKRKINIYVKELSNWIKKNENKYLLLNYNFTKLKYFLLKLRIKNYLQ